MSYGLALHGDGDDKCLSMLNAVEETVNRQLRACKAPSSKSRMLEGRYLFTFVLMLYFYVKKTLRVNFRTSICIHC